MHVQCFCWYHSVLSDESSLMSLLVPWLLLVSIGCRGKFPVGFQVGIRSFSEISFYPQCCLTLDALLMALKPLAKS